MTNDLPRAASIDDQDEKNAKFAELRLSWATTIVEVASATIVLAESPSNNSSSNEVGRSMLSSIAVEARNIRSLVCIITEEVPTCPEGSGQYASSLTQEEGVIITLHFLSSLTKLLTSLATFAAPAPVPDDVLAPNCRIEGQLNVRCLSDQADALNTFILEGLKVLYRDDFRRTYEQMMLDYARGGEILIDLEAEIRDISTDLGDHLLQNRSDVVVRQNDGSIGVLTEDIIYP